MSRDFFINGPTMVYVKGRTDSIIAGATELGLSDAPIRVRPQFNHANMKVDAMGNESPDYQFMLAHVELVISLVHFDRTVLDFCLLEAMGGPPGAAAGNLSAAGTRLGNNLPLYSPGNGTAGNHYVTLGLSSVVAGRPWTFFSAFMTGPPMDFPLGVERSVVMTNWKVVPYIADPWNGGIATYGYPLWSYASLV